MKRPVIGIVGYFHYTRFRLYLNLFLGCSLRQRLMRCRYLRCIGVVLHLYLLSKNRQHISSFNNSEPSYNCVCTFAIIKLDF